MEYLQQHFPLAFESIEKLMKEHGAPKRGGDDTEWRKHPASHHQDHATIHHCAWVAGATTDPDSGMPQEVHVICRKLMALEITLGGGK